MKDTLSLGETTPPRLQRRALGASLHGSPRGRVRVSASRPTPELGSLHLPRRLEPSCGKGWEMSVTLSEATANLLSLPAASVPVAHRSPVPSGARQAPPELVLQPIPSAPSLPVGGSRDVQTPMSLARLVGAGRMQVRPQA